jgi:hypothetical protein
MTIAIDDIIEQICISIVLMESTTLSGKRLSMIVIDNAVEFMLKAFGDTRLIGKAVIDGKVLMKQTWDQKKANFKQLLDIVFLNAKVTVNAQDVLDYHNLRNGLYHEALPYSVERPKLKDYIGKAQTLLNELFGKTFSDKEWKHRIDKARIGLSAKQKAKLVEFDKVDDNHIKIVTEARPLKDIDAICLVVHGYDVVMGRTPLLDELESSLGFSGQSIRPRNKLTNQIAQLRARKVLNKGEYSLSTGARNKLTEEFFIPQG